MVKSIKYFLLIVYLAILGVATVVFMSCDKNDEELNTDERVSIDLLETDKYAVFEKTMVLFENESYAIKTPVSFFIQGFSDVDYSRYLEKVHEITVDAQKKSVLYIKDYFEEYKLPYLLAAFLESGKCHVYGKKSKETILKVEMERWSHFPAPLAGSAGRKFFIKGELFLEVTDVVS